MPQLNSAQFKLTQVALACSLFITQGFVQAEEEAKDKTVAVSTAPATAFSSCAA